MRRIIPMLLVLVLAPAAAAAPAGQNFVAPLSGAEEVSPVDTRARGQTKLQASKDGTELHYKLIASNIENVTQAHIHFAPPGADGPVVAWLYPEGPPPVPIPGRHDGILAEGTITEEDLVGPFADMSLETLLEAMREGNTYVNVHTEQFPGGEIRGQIRSGGPRG